MEFSFTDEQVMIRDTAEAFLADVSDSAAVRRAMALDTGYEEAIWQRVCSEMYWQAMHLPESVGGMGLGAVELAAVMEQMGYHLFCSPFFATACMAAPAALLAPENDARSALLAQLAEGETATLAWMGKGRDWSAAAVQASADRDGEGWRLNGRYRYVVDGHTAATVIVAARDDQGGISLFVLPAETEGMTRQWLPTMDQSRKQAELTLNNVAVTADALLGEAGQSAGLLQQALDIAAIALAAEQAGVAQRCLDMAVEYTSERVQFGRTIASYQAVKHKAADMMLKAEAAKSAAYYGACIAQDALSDGPLKAELAEAASVAKAWCSDAAFFNAGCCIQLYGGVGFTWEYDPQLYFKRAKSAETLLGDSALHRERIAAQLLD